MKFALKMRGENMKTIIILLFVSALFIAGCDNEKPEIKRDVFQMVPEDSREEIRASFKDGAELVTLTEDMHVYRYWGGTSSERGNFYYTRIYTDRIKARKYLSLPNGNTSGNVTFYKIPKGTTIISGYAASMIENKDYGSYATGGGKQIYINDVLIPIRELTGKIEDTADNK